MIDPIPFVIAGMNLLVTCGVVVLMLMSPTQMPPLPAMPVEPARDNTPPTE
jgi:hypothetical protein